MGHHPPVHFLVLGGCPVLGKLGLPVCLHKPLPWRILGSSSHPMTCTHLTQLKKSNPHVARWPVVTKEASYGPETCTITLIYVQ